MAVWSPFIGESLNTQVEPDNVHAVKVIKKLNLLVMSLEKFRIIAVLF